MTISALGAGAPLTNPSMSGLAGLGSASSQANELMALLEARNKAYQIITDGQVRLQQAAAGGYQGAVFDGLRSDLAKIEQKATDLRDQMLMAQAVLKDKGAERDAWLDSPSPIGGSPTWRRVLHGHPDFWKIFHPYYIADGHATDGKMRAAVDAAQAEFDRSKAEYDDKVKERDALRAKIQELASKDQPTAAMSPVVPRTTLNPGMLGGLGWMSGGRDNFWSRIMNL